MNGKNRLRRLRGRLPAVTPAMRAHLATAAVGLMALGFASSPLGAAAANLISQNKIVARVSARLPLVASHALKRTLPKGDGFHDPFTPDSDMLDGEPRSNMLASLGIRTTDAGGAGGSAPTARVPQYAPGMFASAVAPIIVLGPRSAAEIDDGLTKRRVAVGDQVAVGVYVDAITVDGVYLSDGSFIPKGASRQGSSAVPAAMEQVPALFPGATDMLNRGARAGALPPGMLTTPPAAAIQAVQGEPGGAQPAPTPAIPFVPPVLTPQPTPSAGSQSGGGPCVRYPANVSGLSPLPTCPTPASGGR